MKINPLTGKQEDPESRDISYKEAIAAKPGIDNPQLKVAVEAMESLATIIGAFYQNLIDKGIPPAYAERMTDDIRVPIFDAVIKQITEGASK